MGRIVPSVKIGDDEGFTENDLFGYREFGEKFSSLVCEFDQPLTIILDGPWGSGKTTFIKQWAGHLRKEKKVPVIYYDAFSNDYHDDAFISITSEIIDFAKNISEEKAENFLRVAIKVGTSLIPIAVKTSLKIATLGFVNGAELSDSLAEVIKEGVAESSELSADYLEKLIGEKLEGAKQQKEVIKKFRECLEKLSRELANSGEDCEDKKPLVFIIDELDRCKPSFALDVIEGIKHLFSVDGVVFVVVTNLKQMEAAVRGCYGADTNGNLYLEKFYDIRINLPINSNYEIEAIHKYINYACKGHPIDSRMKDEIKKIAIAKTINFRTIDKIINSLSIANYMEMSSSPVIKILITGLSIVRHIDSDLYRKARVGGLSWEEVNNFFGFEEWPEKDWEYSIKLWKFFTGKESDLENKLKFEHPIDKGQDFQKIGTKILDSFRLSKEID
ncbi:KAP family P-loop NTPase fold protein [Rhodospirillum rubrum]|uniref:KAP P-loop n=1 Tax=Rhodospirillum rubrum (strain ATCC 11170 / ATH 1.1.1 / DSM 467 / LMG 4362 / NCIMB 8255 / S1) TaxID=269796 RepID=Q2RMW4_RHORT|nr:P-loop NTPase fold protein [Rhodospirillum rubrum]ABC24531.1 KAP P-loop [Rhodospirillum rubrum ATCC 11170]AEO50283.1 KAP P-loop [Rhodospirillum rubrum F11]MBK5956256.1 NTPase KAP [Rhodospirillum rubrum]QXG80448.1 KAP family NTPase [Rhodospirillum rubrum]HAP99639.1 NTPase KAP [Rhodospirillum rubrum]